MTSRAEPAGDSAGFTLMEILIVLAIMALLLGLVLGRGPLMSRTLLMKHDAGEVADAFREARSKAIGLNRTVSVTFDLKARSFRVGDGAVHRLFGGFDLDLLTTVGSENAIRFEPDGSSTGGHLTLTEDRHKLEVGVDWLNGRVRVSDVS